jgi:DNA-binding transcriptional ArsR family regulator/anti-sigma regulatory factor (Ser/Thr protein kinase)
MDSFLDRLLAADAAAATAADAATATPRRPSSAQPAPEDPETSGSLSPAAGTNVALAEGGSADEPAAADAVAPRGPGAPRLAVYDTLTSPPRVVSVEERDVPALIAALAEKTYHSCREQGGNVPFTVINELIENLIHAFFRDVVITILDGGRVVRISDHGPGVDDKDRAFLPGFTTATAAQRRFIRGVGSGLPIARESLGFLRGAITVEDNLGGGAVFTIKMPQQAAPEAAPPAAAPSAPRLSTRQKKVLVLLMELNVAGPSALAKELHVAPATAYRELNLLEEMGLVHSRRDGKRALTEEGMNLLESLF